MIFPPHEKYYRNTSNNNRNKRTDIIKFKKFTVCMFNLRTIHHHQKIDREQTNKSHLSQQQLHLRNTSIQTIQ